MSAEEVSIVVAAPTKASVIKALNRGLPESQKCKNGISGLQGVSHSLIDSLPKYACQTRAAHVGQRKNELRMWVRRQTGSIKKN